MMTKRIMFMCTNGQINSGEHLFSLSLTEHSHFVVAHSLSSLSIGISLGISLNESVSKQFQSFVQYCGKFWWRNGPRFTGHIVQFVRRNQFINQLHHNVANSFSQIFRYISSPRADYHTHSLWNSYKSQPFEFHQCVPNQQTNHTYIFIGLQAKVFMLDDNAIYSSKDPLNSQNVYNKTNENDVKTCICTTFIYALFINDGGLRWINFSILHMHDENICDPFRSPKSYSWFFLTMTDIHGYCTFVEITSENTAQSVKSVALECESENHREKKPIFI